MHERIKNNSLKWPKNLANAINEHTKCIDNNISITAVEAKYLLERAKLDDVRAKDIIYMYFKDDYTLKIIGSKYLISSNRVRQIISHSLFVMKRAYNELFK